MKRLLCAAFAAMFLLAIGPDAGGWSINTHIYSADVIIGDLSDDGKIQIHEVVRHPDGTMGLNHIGDVAPPAALVTAIMEQQDAFRSGSCSADIYPDMYLGQSEIHPYEPGQRWRATDWARHVVSRAEEWGSGEAHKKALAFAAGWLVHYAGDAVGHTWVNEYAGGAWDWGNMGVVKRHVSLEAYVNSWLPGAKAGTLNVHSDMDPAFVRDALMLDEDVYDSLVRAGYLQFLVDYRLMFRRAEKKCENKMDDWWNPVGWAISPVEAWLEHQRKQADRALYEWAETSNRSARYLAEGNPLKIPLIVNDWIAHWTPRLCLGIPEAVFEVISWLGAPIDWIMMPLKDGLEQGMKWIWEHVLKETFEEIVNAEVFFLSQYDEETRALVDEEMGVTEGATEMDWQAFDPFWDTVVLGKLALLDGTGLNELKGLLGAEFRVEGPDDNILWDCIDSLDASYQLALYPKFRLIETPELEETVYRRLFMCEPYQQPPSAIDPAHVLVYPGREKYQVVFGIPTPDPGVEGHRVVGYVYEQSEDSSGPPARVPFFEHHIPSKGTEGLYNGLIYAQYKAPRTGTYRFHLATAWPEEGSADLVEDEGIDISFKVHREPEGMADLPEGLPFDMEELKARRDRALEGLRAMEKTLADLPPDTPPEVRAHFEKMREEIRKSLAEAEAAGLGGQEPPPGPGHHLAPMTFAPRALDWFINQLSGTGEASEFPEAEALLGMVRMVITVVKGPEGPIPNASVTMLKPSVLQKLRIERGVAELELSRYTLGDFHMGYANAKGQIGLPGIPNGDYVLLVSADGYAKRKVMIHVDLGDKFGQVLPDIVLTKNPAEAEGEPDDGQHHTDPDYVLEPSTRVLTLDDVQADGRAVAMLRIRPMSEFTGPLKLEALGLPAGVTVEFPENPVVVSSVREVPIVFRGDPAKAPRLESVKIRATGGGLVKEFEIAVALAGVQLVMNPPKLVIKAGGKAPIRLGWRGRGAAAKVLLAGTLPNGIRVEAERFKAHRHARPLKLRGLTVQQANEARGKLLRVGPIPQVARPQVPVVQVDKPPVPQLTPALVAKGPEDAPKKGILLAPNGWVDLTVFVGPNVKKGVHKVPVKCVVGRMVITEIVEVTIE